MYQKVGEYFGFVRKELLLSTKDNNLTQNKIVFDGKRLLFSQAKLSRFENGELSNYYQEEFDFLIGKIGQLSCDYVEMGFKYERLLDEYFDIIENRSFSSLCDFHKKFECEHLNDKKIFYISEYFKIIELSLDYYLYSSIPNENVINDLFRKRKFFVGRISVLLAELIFYFQEIYGCDLIDVNEFNAYLESLSSNTKIFLLLKSLYFTKRKKFGLAFRNVSNIQSIDCSHIVRFRVMRINIILGILDIDPSEIHFEGIPTQEVHALDFFVAIKSYEMKQYYKAKSLFQSLLTQNDFYAIRVLPYVFDLSFELNDMESIPSIIEIAKMNADRFGKIHVLNLRLYEIFAKQNFSGDFDRFLSKEIFASYRLTRVDSSLRKVMEKHLFMYIKKSKRYKLLVQYELISKNIDIDFDIYSIISRVNSKSHLLKSKG